MSDYDKSKLYHQNLIDNGYFTTRGSLDYASELYKNSANLVYPWTVPSSDKFDCINTYCDPAQNYGIVPGVTGVISPNIAMNGTSAVAMTYDNPVEINLDEGESAVDQIMYIRISGVADGGPTTEQNAPVLGGIGVKGCGWLYDGRADSDPLFTVMPSGSLSPTNWSASNLFFMDDALHSGFIMKDALKPFLVIATTHTAYIDIQEVVLINLTKVFGKGNEPTKDWCDENINYDSLEVDQNQKEDKKMGRLVWDQDGKRMYETGTDRGVLYIKSEDGTYPKGIAWSGLTGVTESPSGAENTALYADNIKYLNLRSAEEFGGTIEAYFYPDEFMQCDGSAELAEGVYIGQQDRKSFGFSYRTVLGNDTKSNAYGYKLHLVYGADATPSERAYATVNDSPEAITFSWEFTTTPVNVAGGKPTSLLTIDSTKVDAEKLKTLEDILYGKDGTGESDPGVEPRLPLPDEVASIFAAG